MSNNYYAVIMAGGIGSRFWPVSTVDLPKQFHDMLGTGKSLLQQTFSRLTKLIPQDQILILTNERYLELTLKQLPDITENQVVLEPAMRNTAPCIAMAAMKIKKMNPDALMLVAPSDHWIEDEDSFVADVQACFDAAQQDDILMTLGIEPTFPNTGYGYIEAENLSTSPIAPVKQFREKPDYETAKSFVKAGNFMWNAGIFIWSVKSILRAFENHLPAMHSLFVEGISTYNTGDEKAYIDINYERAENISIDFGIMEKAINVFVKKATFDWNDLGTWGALHDKIASTETENAVVRATPYLNNATGNMIYSEGEKLVVVDGISDYIIVDKANTLLIFPKSKEQNIKKLVQDVTTKFGDKYN